MSEIDYDQLSRNDLESIGAKQLISLLDTIRKPITEPRIRLYRVITGQGVMEGNEYIHTGVDLQRLRKYGIFETNKSLDQVSTDRSRRVPGLPVFTTPQEAMMWLYNKQFINNPAIAVLDIPISLLTSKDSQVRLIRNTLDVFLPETVLTVDDLQNHSKGSSLIQGECYLSSTGIAKSNALDSVREYEILIQPKSLRTDRSVDFINGFTLIVDSTNNT